MKKGSLTRLWIPVLALALISACSGGGGGGVSGTTTQPTKAVITLSTAVVNTIPADTIIAGYDITIDLPAGVTVTSTAAPPRVDDGVVTVVGSAVGSSFEAVYTAATSTISGKVLIQIVKADGFIAGDFAAVTCDIAAGFNPSPSDFPQPVFAASGFDTIQISTVDLTNNLSLTATAVIN
jgi:hypothetical protein